MKHVDLALNSILICKFPKLSMVQMPSISALPTAVQALIASQVVKGGTDDLANLRLVNKSWRKAGSLITKSITLCGNDIGIAAAFPELQRLEWSAMFNERFSEWSEVNFVYRTIGKLPKFFYKAPTCVTMAGIARINQLQALRELSLRNLSAEDLPKLSGLAIQHQLSRFELSIDLQGITSTALNALTQLTGLTALQICITGAKSVHAAVFRRLTKLQALKLASSEPSPLLTEPEALQQLSLTNLTLKNVALERFELPLLLNSSLKVFKSKNALLCTQLTSNSISQLVGLEDLTLNIDSHAIPHNLFSNGALSNLLRLNLSSSQVDNYLDGISTLAQLRFLKLDQHYADNPKLQSLQFVRPLIHLQSLVLLSKISHYNSTLDIASLSQLTELKELELKGANLPSDFCSTVVKFQSLRALHLKSCVFGGFYYGNAAMDWSQLSVLSYLKSIELIKIELTSQAVSRWRTLTDLVRLRLKLPTNSAFELQSVLQFTNLQDLEIDLPGIKIDSNQSDLQNISGLSTLTRLEHLVMPKYPLIPQEVVEIAQLIRLSSLEFNCREFERTSLSALLQLSSLRRLRELKLQTKDVDEMSAVAQQLQNALPKLHRIKIGEFL